MTDGVWRLATDAGERWAVGPSHVGPVALLDPAHDLDGVLAGRETFARWMTRTTAEPLPAAAPLLAPIGTQEVWAAGVTFTRSRAARREESTQPDHYDLVYDADRPELFFKSTARRVRGPGEDVMIRADSSWDVPEPEVALVADRTGELVAVTLANDVSSRDIEGQNPLYLPQAKVYEGACALGPCLVPADESWLRDGRLTMCIERDGAQVYDGAVAMSEMRRSPRELLAWLFRGLRFADGVVLLTGTGLVPDPSFTLRDGDRVDIALDAHLRLSNVVASLPTP